MSSEEHLSKVIASKMIYGKNRFMPSAREHASRNNFNMRPSPTSYLDKVSNEKNQKRELFQDRETNVLWERQPWYLNMFHAPWKNHKFLALDSEVISDAAGSSEILIPKKARFSSTVTDNADSVTNITYPCDEIKKGGSYNYRTKGVKHFFADILPVLIYWKRV